MEQQNKNEQEKLLRHAALETANSILVLKNRQEQELLQTQTELQKALEEVKRAEAEFSSAFEFAPIGMAMVYTNGTLLRVNKNLCQLLGYSREELLQRTFIDLTHPDDVEVSLQYYTQLKIGEIDSYQLEKRYITKNKTVVWANVSLSLIAHPDSSSRYTIAQIMDITNSKAAEEALRRSEQEAKQLAKHYKSILDSQSVYVLKTDIQGRYTYVNNYYRRAFGLEGEFIGTSAMNNIVTEDLPKCMVAVGKSLRQPEVAHEAILRKVTADGKILGGKWELTGILDKDGQVSEVLCVGFDITEQLESLEKARHLLDVTNEQNVKLKSFAQIVSHNLRSHSANFAGLLALMDGATKEEKASYTEMLKASAEQLEQTIRNLNEIIAINEHVSRPRERKYLKEEVNKTLYILNGLLVKHAIKVKISIDEDVFVHVVPAYLDSILLNLISNAIKYRSPIREAIIEIYSTKENNHTLLVVKDNGLGIDLNRHGEKLFGLYKKFHGNPDARGFGLYITKTQVEAMGGSIAVESEEGIGSIFKVYFNENN